MPIFTASRATFSSVVVSFGPSSSSITAISISPDSANAGVVGWRATVKV